MNNRKKDFGDDLETYVGSLARLSAYSRDYDNKNSDITNINILITRFIESEVKEMRTQVLQTLNLLKEVESNRDK